ncbi:MAG: sensor histidine kinase [Eubacteriales bacterium]|nr:sensor histidine kinase [Eubacteriales bacterium]
MNDLIRYLKQQRSLLLYAAIAILLVFLVPFLTGQPLTNTWYIVLLLSAILLFFLLADGLRWLRRRKQLRALLGRTQSIAGCLPEPPKDASEEDCFALLKEADEACTRLRLQLDEAQQEQLGYYTLWVHQIKTPISAMRLVLQAMKSDETGTLYQELFKIEQYADLALRYAKLSDIASDLVIAPCDVFDVVKQSVKKHALPFVYQKLSVTISPMEKTIVTDKRWLGFILEQLLSNAAKYTHTGGVTVTLTDNRLTVRDTGIGIRSEDLPRIFERGYTGYNGRLDARASGVGLYLAKKAADALSIRITVDSQLGHGSAFTLYLPETPAAVEGYYAPEAAPDAGSAIDAHS